MANLFEVRGLKKYFPVGTNLRFVNLKMEHFQMKQRVFTKEEEWVRAVDGVSFKVDDREVFGLVGESGCGKTTIGRLIVKLMEPTEGDIYLDGKNIVKLSKNELKDFRKNVGMIFQYPYDSLNPRFTILESVKEPLDIHRIGEREDRIKKVVSILKEVGLNPEKSFLKRYPHELSGGQRQRVAIARTLIVNPKMVIADEPCSMLDVSIRAEIMKMMIKLKEEFGLSILYITHDISEARNVTDSMAVMYLGKIVESGRTDDIIENPSHPYSKALISVVPDIDPDIKRGKIELLGGVPSSSNIPKGCRFNPRCPYAMDICREKEPDYIRVEKDHIASCHLL